MARTRGLRPTLTIVIKNFRFIPARPQVRPGERIEVKNDDSLAHTLSAGPAARISALFGTGTISPGRATFFTAPKRSGTYAFCCKFHRFMVGTLVVGNASAAAPSAPVSLTARVSRAGLRGTAAALNPARPVRLLSYCGGRPGKDPHAGTPARPSYAARARLSHAARAEPGTALVTQVFARSRHRPHSWLSTAGRCRLT